MDLNKVLLIGRLGAKPELKQTQGGPVARLRLATSWEKRTGEGASERATDWHNVVVFGRQAEACAERLDAGRLVYVEGFLHTHSWKDKEGKERSDREVRAQYVNFLYQKGEPATSGLSSTRSAGRDAPLF